jgi:multisubunit Na+/H+ antiporter MnhE subunit
MFVTLFGNNKMPIIKIICNTDDQDKTKYNLSSVQNLLGFLISPVIFIKFRIFFGRDATDFYKWRKFYIFIYILLLSHYIL